MSYFTVASVKIKAGSEQAYMETFVPEVSRTIQEAGGKHLIASNNVQLFTHSHEPNRVVITEWPNKDAADTWWNSHGKMLIEGLGSGYAEIHMTGVEEMQPQA